MIYLQQGQPTLTLKVCPNGRIDLIKNNRMLGPDLTLTVQFLKNLSATVIPKQLTPRGRNRGKGGSPISSSFPRHGARIRTETQKQNQQKQKEKPRADCKLVQKKKKRIKIYMMHE